MGVVYTIADLHLGHTNMALHRGFNSIKEHDNFIVEKWNSVVNKRDTVWILGDVTMSKASEYWKLDLLNGIKKVVLGNHDKPQHSIKMLNYVNSVCGVMEKGGWIFTHIPIHPHELYERYLGNVHGHMHENSIADDRYINVSAERLSYTPVLITDLINLKL